MSNDDYLTIKKCIPQNKQFSDDHIIACVFLVCNKFYRRLMNTEQILIPYKNQEITNIQLVT